MMPIERPNEQPDDHAADRERDRGGQVLEDLVEHVDVRDVAAAEVLVGEDALDVVAELHDQRPVEPEVLRGCARSTSGVGCRPARRAAGSVDGKTLKTTKVTALTTISSRIMPSEAADDVAGHGRVDLGAAGPPRYAAGRPAEWIRSGASLPDGGEVPVPGRAVAVLHAAHVRRDRRSTGSPTCTGSPGACSVISLLTSAQAWARSAGSVSSLAASIALLISGTLSSGQFEFCVGMMFSPLNVGSSIVCGVVEVLRPADGRADVRLGVRHVAELREHRVAGHEAELRLEAHLVELLLGDLRDRLVRVGVVADDQDLLVALVLARGACRPS